MSIRFTPIAALIFFYVLAPAVWAQSQHPSENRRSVLVRVAPQYPEAARRIGLGGTVRAIAQVGSDGKVRKVQAVGGSPLLVQAAENAITKWKFSPGGESQETVELHFTP